MRINDYDTLVNEKKAGPSDKFYCVAVAAGVATVVGGVAAAGTSIYNASQAKKAGQAGGGSGKDLYGSNPELPDYHNNVQLPAFNAQMGSRDYKAMLPDLLRISAGATQGGITAREKVFPGGAKLMKNASDVLSQLSAGNVPQDVIDRTQQIVAERGGGAHNMIGTGPDQLQTDFARNIGQTSQNQVDRFLSAAPQWEQLADQFAYTPAEAAQDAIQLLSQRYNYALGAGSLQKGIDENQYSAALNSARGASMPNPAVVGARNDALLQQAMQGISGGNSNYLTAIGGVVNGLGGILQNYNSAGGAARYSNTVANSPQFGNYGVQAKSGYGEFASPEFL